MNVLINLFIFMGLFLIIYGYSLNLNRNKQYGHKCKTIYVQESPKTLLYNITDEQENIYENETSERERRRSRERADNSGEIFDTLTEQQQKLVELFRKRDLTPEDMEEFREKFIYGGTLFNG